MFLHPLMNEIYTKLLLLRPHHEYSFNHNFFFPFFHSQLEALKKPFWTELSENDLNGDLIKQENKGGNLVSIHAGVGNVNNFSSNVNLKFKILRYCLHEKRKDLITIGNCDYSFCSIIATRW